MWRIWSKALGEKAGRTDNEADKVAIIRSLIMLQLIITNGFIIAGNVKNLWFNQCVAAQLAPLSADAVMGTRKL